MSSNDIFGKALLDYQNGSYSEDIKTYSSLDEEDIIPLPYLFRGYKDMPPLERKALQLCKGTVLDIGCGAGSHSLYLQQNESWVTALDSSAGAIETCSLRGVKNTVHSTIGAYDQGKYDTLLLLMNGIGLAGKLSELGAFLSHLKSILKPNGQILLDSSDIIYMFEEEEGGVWLPISENYYGEVEFKMSYKGMTSDSFFWLYTDFDTLTKVAAAQDLYCEMICEGKHYDYLARLTVMKR